MCSLTLPSSLTALGDFTASLITMEMDCGAKQDSSGKVETSNAPVISGTGIYGGLFNVRLKDGVRILQTYSMEFMHIQ